MRAVVRADPVKAGLSGLAGSVGVVWRRGDLDADQLVVGGAATTAAVVRLLPGWFLTHVKAPTFLVLPLWMKRPNQPDVVLGLIYVDQAEAGSLVVDERTLSLLRTLRNQVIMAFKQTAG